MKLDSLTPGQTLGNFTIVSRFDPIGSKNCRWNCICNFCGKSLKVSRQRLPKQKSCGCQTIGNLKDKSVAGFNKVIHQYKVAAKQRNLEWHLTNEDVKHLTSQNCFYCNAAPNSRSGWRYKAKDTINQHSIYIYNGIDRLINSKGYFLENCVPCCGICNKAKNKLDKDDFLSLISKIYNNLIKKD